MTPVVDDSGAEIVLDRPTSLEFVEGTAYVVTLAGEVLEIDDVAPRISEDTSSRLLGCRTDVHGPTARR
jgi:hypothetical protein